MPINFSKIEAAQEAFNKKYGVSFDIEGFDEKVRLFEGIDGENDMDELYRLEFADLYKDAFTSFVDDLIEKKGNHVILTEMLTEFEENIMAPYREGLISENKPYPKPFGNRSISHHIKTAQRRLATLPDYPDLYARQRIHNGELKLSVIKSYCDNVMKKGDTSIEKLSMLHDYSSALAHANEKRSFIWKLFHLPQYLSEQNYAEKLHKYVSKACGADEPIDLEENEMWERVCHIHSPDQMQTFKDGLQSELEDVIWQETQSAFDSDRKKLHIRELKPEGEASTKSQSPDFQRILDKESKYEDKLHRI